MATWVLMSAESGRDLPELYPRTRSPTPDAPPGVQLMTDFVTSAARA